VLLLVAFQIALLFPSTFRLAYRIRLRFLAILLNFSNIAQFQQFFLILEILSNLRNFVEFLQFGAISAVC